MSPSNFLLLDTFLFGKLRVVYKLFLNTLKLLLGCVNTILLLIILNKKNIPRELVLKYLFNTSIKLFFN